MQPSAAAAAAPEAAADEDSQGSEAEDAGARSGAGAPALTARAAKRQRQRERRKMGRKARLEGIANGCEDNSGGATQTFVDPTGSDGQAFAGSLPGDMAKMQEYAALDNSAWCFNGDYMSCAYMTQDCLAHAAAAGMWAFVPTAAGGIAAHDDAYGERSAGGQQQLVEQPAAENSVSDTLRKAVGGVRTQDSPSTQSRPDEDVASMNLSSSESCSGEGFPDSDQAKPEDPCRKKLAESMASQPPPPTSIMDVMRAQLQEVLNELEAGNTDACKAGLKSALSMCSGMEPHVERLNRKISAGREQLLRASDSEDWTHKYVTQETDLLFHANMRTGETVMQTLQFLSRSLRASRVLQIGVLDGQATLGLAEALPSHGRIVALESDHGFARFAQRALTPLRHSEKVALIWGDVAHTLQSLALQNDGDRFHLVFVDGQRGDYNSIVDRILERDFLAPGGILVVDHCLGRGAFADPAEREGDAVPCWPGHLDVQEAFAKATALNERLLRDSRLESIVLPIQSGLTLVRRVAAGDGLTAEGVQITPALPTKGSSTDIEEFSLEPSCDQSLSLEAPASAASTPILRPRSGSEAIAARTLGGMQTRSMGADMPRSPMLWPSTPENSPMLRPVSSTLVQPMAVGGPGLWTVPAHTFVPWV
mmetsp:Transcript_2096/g.5960  ORF Transcript_2096/g.5960 Transcript_2096/m.5960 type:complete len:650 (-) Transcript_2096:495-2444(-)